VILCILAASDTNHAPARRRKLLFCRVACSRAKCRASTCALFRRVRSASPPPPVGPETAMQTSRGPVPVHCRCCGGRAEAQRPEMMAHGSVGGPCKRRRLGAGKSPPEPPFSVTPAGRCCVSRPFTPLHAPTHDSTCHANPEGISLRCLPITNSQTRPLFPETPVGLRRQDASVASGPIHWSPCRHHMLPAR
jgi:hypothetical protein